MFRVAKVRIYPNEQQKLSLAKAFGTTRARVESFSSFDQSDVQRNR